jgi:multiple antibiotic resistance protein
MDVYKAAITLFLVMDALGNIPLFVSILGGIAPKRWPWIIIRESFIAFLILCLFLVAGKPILTGLDISDAALGITGGIILFLIAIKMIFPPENKRDTPPQGEPLIVPLAIPLLAGPSALATLLLIANEHPNELWQVFFAIFLAAAGSTLVLLCAYPLRRLLGDRVLLAVGRLMGLILTTIAVQMFLSGIEKYFHLA